MNYQRPGGRRVQCSRRSNLPDGPLCARPCQRLQGVEGLTRRVVTLAR